MPKMGYRIDMTADRSLPVDRREKPLLTELNAVAVETRRKQNIDVPMQPFPDDLACRRICTLKSAKRLGQMLDDGGRLEVDTAAVEQNRNLPPGGKAPKIEAASNRFGQNTKLENGLAGFVRDFHPPFGIERHIDNDIAGQGSADGNGLLARGFAVLKSGFNAGVREFALGYMQ
jgi:hypothetical protein